MKKIILLLIFINLNLIGSNNFKKKEEDQKELSKLLFKSIFQACPDILKSILETGFSPLIKDSRGYSPLMIAAYSHQLKCLQLLIRHNSNPSDRGPFDETLLIISASKNDANFKYLLKNRERFGIQIDAQNKKGMTALMIATQYNQSKVINQLIKAGADINLTNKNKESALHIAAENGFFEIVKILVQKGARFNKKNKNKKTPAELALQSFNELHQLLMHDNNSKGKGIIFFHHDTLNNLKKCYNFLMQNSSS